MSRWIAGVLAGAIVGGTLVAGPAAAHHRQFDLQAHRGGLGLRSESTLSSFGNALRLGVTTLELDVQITEDRQAVVTHDRRVDGRKCTDTAPATPGDPEFPYVGKYVNTLTLPRSGRSTAARSSCRTIPGRCSRRTPGCRCCARCSHS